MRILARDPGQKPGYALLDEHGTVLWADIIHYTTPYILEGLDVFATEGQWYFRDSKANVNDLFKLAFDAGWSLRGIHAKRYMRIPPQVWRGGSSADKAQQQRRILTTLSLAERKLFATIPKSRHGDVLDAIGIGRGALANLTTTTYDWPGKGYGK